MNNYQAGRVKDFVGNWQRLTSEAWILKMIQGIDIEFIDFKEEECAIVDNEIDTFF